MLFKEFGDKNNPAILLLHGGGLSWWSLKPQIELLKDDYFVVTPIIDGHGDDWNNTFVSIEDSSQKVINYIKDNMDGEVYAICGLSIGAQIVVDILSKESGITKFAVIESALTYPMKKVSKLILPVYNLCYGLVKKRWYAKLQAKTLFVPEEMFDSYFNDSSRMTKETLINTTKSNSDFSLSPNITKTSAKVLIIVGGKEISVMKKSANILNEKIENSTLKVIEKSGHGEISLVHSDRYVKMIKDFFSE